MVVEGCQEVIPRRAGVPAGVGGCRHIRVVPGEVVHQSAPLARIRDVPVEEGQEAAVRNRLPPYPQSFEAVLLPAWRRCKVGGKHEMQGPGNVAQLGQGVVVRRPPVFEMGHGEPAGPVFRGEAPDGRRVASRCVYFRGWEYVGGVEYEAGEEGCSDERGHVPMPPHVWLRGRL